MLLTTICCDPQAFWGGPASKRSPEISGGDQSSVSGTCRREFPTSFPWPYPFLQTLNSDSAHLAFLTRDQGTMVMLKLKRWRWNRRRLPAFPTLLIAILPQHFPLSIWSLQILCYNPDKLPLILWGSTFHSPPYKFFATTKICILIYYLWKS